MSFSTMDGRTIGLQRYAAGQTRACDLNGQTACEDVAKMSMTEMGLYALGSCGLLVVARLVNLAAGLS